MTMDKLARHRLLNAHDVLKQGIEDADFVNRRFKKPGNPPKRIYGPMADDAIYHLRMAEALIRAVLDSRPMLSMPREEIERRWPRLLRAMMWGACLSQGEAVTCLRDYIGGYAYSGEAVNHYGGTKEVVKRASAARIRHVIATVRRTDPQVLEV